MAEPSVLIYGTSVAGLRAAATFGKQGYKVYLINSGKYLGEVDNELSYKKPRTICNACLRFFLGRLPALEVINQADIVSYSGKPGNFAVKVKAKETDIDEKKCIECGLCAEKEGVSVIQRPMAGNIYEIDREKADIEELVKLCPTGAINPDPKEKELELKVGAIILSPEVGIKRQEELKSFGVGENPDVVRIADIEHWFLGWGPNYEKFVRPSDGKQPSKVSYIITQGLKGTSNDGGFGPFLHSLQSAVSLKKLNKDIDITIFSKEIYAYGKGQMEYLREAEQKGINIQLVEDLEINGTEIKYMGKSFNSEMIILSEPENPPEKNKHIAEIFNAKLDENGYIQTPEENSLILSEGIFTLGETIGHFGTLEAVEEGAAVGVDAIKYIGKPAFQPPKLPPLKEIDPYEPPKIGIYLCECATKFGEFVDIESLKGRLLSIDSVEAFETVKFLCLKDGVDKIKNDIDSGKVNRIVLASCSPWERGNFLQNQVRMAGLPVSFTEIAEVRDYGVFPHIETASKEVITEKVYELIKMAVKKVEKSLAYVPPISDFIQKAVVIGNGYPALRTASRIGERGFPVDVLSSMEDIGGVWKEIEEFSSKIEQEVKKIKGNKNIGLHIGIELLNIDGYAGHYSVRFKEGEEEKEISAGVIIIASDGEFEIPVDLSIEEKKKFITLRDFKKDWENINVNNIVIQCADSIYAEDRSSLVRSSCLEGANYAAKYKKAHPDAEVYILYGTMVNSGTVKRYIDEALKAGVKFYGYYWKEKPVQTETEDKVLIKFKDAKTKENREIEAEMFVFSQGIVPVHEDNKKIADMLGLTLDEDGYFKIREDPLEEINAKFIPNDLGTNGIFIAGLGKSPKDIQEMLIDADAITQDALYLLPKGKQTPWTGWLVAYTNTRKCAGCGFCVDACAYSARVIDMEKKVSVVREINCQGCGACETACPSGAAVLRVGNAPQILEMVDVLA